MFLNSTWTADLIFSPRLVDISFCKTACNQGNHQVWSPIPEWQEVDNDKWNLDGNHDWAEGSMNWSHRLTEYQTETSKGSRWSSSPSSRMEWNVVSQSSMDGKPSSGTSNLRSAWKNLSSKLSFNFMKIWSKEQASSKSEAASWFRLGTFHQSP